jgi:hypothetical protein
MIRKFLKSNQLILVGLAYGIFMFLFMTFFLLKKNPSDGKVQ